MYTITKQSCIKEITSSNNALLAALTVMCLLAGLRTWASTHSLFWVFLIVVIYIVGLILAIQLTRKRIRRMMQKGYFLTEDVLIRVEEKNAAVNRWHLFKNGARYDYDLTFSRSGVHRITLFSNSEPEEFDADYAAVHFSRPGDAFYLAKLSDNDEQIIKCFPAKYCTISEEDFERDNDIYRHKSKL